MFILIFSNHSRSNTQANEYIFGLARQIQNRAEKQGSCPERWKGWPRKKFSAGEEKSYESEIEKLGITYRVFYRPAKDGRTFEVRLWTDIDKDLVVNGGVGKTLRAYYSDESGKEFPLE